MRFLDPLHCAGNGSNSPTNINPLADFGFTVFPGPASGDLLIDILALNNKATPSFFSFSNTGTLAGTASLFGAAPWTSGDFDAYLGISAQAPRFEAGVLTRVLAGGFLFSRERPNRATPEHVSLT